LNVLGHAQVPLVKVNEGDTQVEQYWFCWQNWQ